MEGIKSLAMMTAMMVAAAEVKSGNIFELENDKPRLRCGDCEHCPTGNKTFCKTAKHHTTKTTNCTNCKYYKVK